MRAGRGRSSGGQVWVVVWGWQGCWGVGSRSGEGRDGQGGRWIWAELGSRSGEERHGPLRGGVGSRRSQDSCEPDGSHAAWGTMESRMLRTWSSVSTSAVIFLPTRFATARWNAASMRS